jgi:hypothetical protein
MFIMKENEMLKGTLKPIFILICFVFMLLGLNISSSAQDNATLYAEIAGDYEYEFEGQVIIIIYTVEDGLLYGNTEGNPESPTLLEPVEGKELEFTATGNDGNFYVISFSRDEEGKVTKSLLSTQGIEIEGKKIVKKSTS